MRRLNDYSRFLVWGSGLGYIALWIVTFFTLDYGKTALGVWGGCSPDPNTALFYWVCDSASPFSILATIANSALTITIWAPVYLAAATIRPEGLAIAVPIIGTHLFGLATAILVSARLMLALLQTLRGKLRSKQDQTSATTSPPLVPAMPSDTASSIDFAMPPLPEPRRVRPQTPPRSTFGLRGSADVR